MIRRGIHPTAENPTPCWRIPHVENGVAVIQIRIISENVEVEEKVSVSQCRVKYDEEVKESNNKDLQIIFAFMPDSIWVGATRI